MRWDIPAALLAMFWVWMAATPADAQQKWSSDPARREWFRSQTMTPETRQRLGTPVLSCCDEGDNYPTRFRGVVNDGSQYGADAYEYEHPPGSGVWLPIPPDIVQRKKTPDGRPILFRSPLTGTLYCFIIDEPGI